MTTVAVFLAAVAIVNLVFAALAYLADWLDR